MADFKKSVILNQQLTFLMADFKKSVILNRQLTFVMADFKKSVILNYIIKYTAEFGIVKDSERKS